MKRLTTCHFTLFFLFSTTLHGQIVINEIRASNSHVELKNTGTSTVNVGTYWLCRFPDYNQLSGITLVCGGDLNLEAGAIATVELEYSLDPEDDELALYFNSDFGNPASIRDYVEWGSSGHVRSMVAQGAIPPQWQMGDFVPSWDDCASIEYDGTGNSSADWVAQDVPSMPCLANTLNGCGLMPLDLIEFNVSQVENGAGIKWKAVHDVTVKSILLEHSLDLKTWAPMHEWIPVGPDFDDGNYNHANIGSGMHYYRLLTAYSDGGLENSEIATLHLCFDENALIISPNPTQGLVDIIVMAIEDVTEVEYELVNAQGDLCLSKYGPTQLQLDLSAFGDGVYFLRIPALGIVERVIKAR